MPAPAVIPAPKAYINAVAVKGFVVELRAALRDVNVHSTSDVLTPALAVREHQKQKTREWFPRHPHVMHAKRAPVIFTVTKEVRPRQSFRHELESMG